MTKAFVAIFRWRGGQATTRPSATRSSRQSAEPSLGRGVDGCGARWQHAQLPHERHLVTDRPVLDGLAVFEAQDVDIVHGDLTVRRRNSHQITCVSTKQGAVDNHKITFADHLMDIPALIAEYAS